MIQNCKVQRLGETDRHRCEHCIDIVTSRQGSPVRRCSVLAADPPQCDPEAVHRSLRGEKIGEAKPTDYGCRHELADLHRYRKHGTETIDIKVRVVTARTAGLDLSGQADIVSFPPSKTRATCGMFDAPCLATGRREQST